MPESAEQQHSLSAVLIDVADYGEPRISMDELMARFGGRALGALLFVFGLACMLPLPPGATTIFGFPLLLLAPQLVIGGGAPWLPEKLRSRTMNTADLRKGLLRFIPWLQKVEAVSKPRLMLLFSPLGERAIGFVCTVLALVLILPIPLGNLLPAAAVCVFSLSLVQRDGFLALAGYALTAASTAVLVVAFGLIIHTAKHVLQLITGA